MVILPHPRYGDFYCFLTPPSQGRLSRTKRDLFTKLGQCATEAPCQCFLEFQTNPKFDPKWWFCPTRGMAIFTDFACFLTPPSKGRISRTKRDLFTKLGQCATEAPCQCFLEFQTNPKFDPKWWFCPTRGMAIFTDFACFLTPPWKGRISRTKRDLLTKLGQCATETPCQCLLEFQTNPKFDPKWWFCPTRGMAIFTDFACFLTPPSKGRISRTKRDLFTKLGQCATAWVSKKSKIWSKMVILPHPRYGDFYCFLTPPSQGRISRTKRNLFTKLCQGATETPCQCSIEFVRNLKFDDPKWWFCLTRGMAIFTDFAYFLTPPSKGRISRTKRDLFTKLGQCATEAPCQCLIEFQTNPEFDLKWWFCHIRGMAIFTYFACFLTPPWQGRLSRTKREISSPNLVSVLLKPHVNVRLSFKQIQNLTQNGDFATSAVWQFLPISPAF